jgi:carbon-monoxide dehydrogenase medium subunit
LFYSNASINYVEEDFSMKSPEFSYLKAQTMADVFSALKTHGDAAQLLAGGQSLLAMLNLRMANPSILIDISGLDSLKGIQQNGNVIRIGALTTHHEIDSSHIVKEHIPLLAQAVPYVAHLAIRNKGTIGGSLALGDPAAEYPAVALALNATLIIQSATGERRVKASEFFISLYRTAVQADEILIGVEFPIAKPNQRFVFSELARRKGDYAMAGMALALSLEGQTIQDVALAFMAMDDKPILAPRAMKVLTGQSINSQTISQAQAALDEDLQPAGDLSANAATKKHLSRVLLSRALIQAGATHV